MGQRLRHRRAHEFSDMRPFFCQVEAVETATRLAGAARKTGKSGARFQEQKAYNIAQVKPRPMHKGASLEGQTA